MGSQSIHVRADDNQNPQLMHRKHLNRKKEWQRFKVVDRDIMLTVNSIEPACSFVSIDGYDGGLNGERVEGVHLIDGGIK